MEQTNELLLVFIAILFVFACLGVAVLFSLVGIIKEARKARKSNNKNQK